jgi:TatD DNase family protein
MSTANATETNATKPGLIDSHCHLDRLDLRPFNGLIEGVIEHGRSLGVSQMLCVAIDLEALPAMRDLCRGLPGVSTTVGVHPNHDEGEEPTVEQLIELCDDPQVVAIGETGLDYFRSRGNLDWQRERFRRHIAAARETGLPLVIHTREAYEDTIRILKEERAGECGGVMHCFSGDWEMAQQALDLGFHISLSGIVTFNNADDLREVARRVPEERLLVETDAPYLTPKPHRGKPNLPGYTRHVAESIAEQRGVEWQAVALMTSHNYHNLFPRAASQR